MSDVRRSAFVIEDDDMIDAIEAIEKATGRSALELALSHASLFLASGEGTCVSPKKQCQLKDSSFLANGGGTHGGVYVQ